MEPLKGYDRWLEPPDDGPAVCDYCGKEQNDPDELEAVEQKNGKRKYACPTCYEKQACSKCEKQADDEFELDNGETNCETCFYKSQCRDCGKLLENCDCKKEP